MRVTEVRPSEEVCHEAGWFAWDFYLEKPLTEEDIGRFRPLGSFLYLSSLKKPFFKSEGEYFHIKGIRGEDHFRAAVHAQHTDLLNMLRERLEDT